MCLIKFKLQFSLWLRPSRNTSASIYTYLYVRVQRKIHRSSNEIKVSPLVKGLELITGDIFGNQRADNEYILHIYSRPPSTLLSHWRIPDHPPKHTRHQSPHLYSFQWPKHTISCLRYCCCWYGCGGGGDTVEKAT